jgi:hypothetical protein
LNKIEKSRSHKSIPRPFYDKIKEYIENSFVLDFNMLLKDNNFFYYLKPDLRYKLICEVFGDRDSMKRDDFIYKY